MANIEKLIPLILKWEGGYVNDPDDRGGPTNMGITLATWKSRGYDKNGDGIIDENDVKQISREDARLILEKYYWNRWQADKIESQAIANLLVGWVWGSGLYGITFPQGILKVKQDGIVGPKTLNAVNNFPDQEELFYRLWHGKRAYLNLICIDRPQNKKFLKGWLNRLNDCKWFPIALLVLILGFSSCRSAKVLENREMQYVSVEKVDSFRMERTFRESESKDVSSTIKSMERQGEVEILKLKYDLSLAPDSLTGSYPVSEEIRIKRLVQQKERICHLEFLL